MPLNTLTAGVRYIRTSISV